MASSVQYRNIKKSYRPGHPIIHDFSLDIKEGEFIVLVGPSGCGKSTLLRILAGLEDLNSGEILIDGNPVNHLPPKARDIAMVFQNYALYPHMSIYNNIAFGLKLRKISKEEIDKKVRNTAEILEISDLLQRKPKELSGGQRQRAALGRAIVRDPKVFLFDEPLSNLDAKLRVQMRTQIKSLHRQLKATMIYVTHDQVEAMTMGDRIVILKEGLVQQIGDPLTVYDRPANTFVAGFIGSPPMNFFNGRIEGGGFRSEEAGMDLEIGEMANVNDGMEITLGIRPEDILTESGDQKAIVQLSEPLGGQTLLHLMMGNVKFTAAIPATLDIPGDSIIDIGFKLKKIHFFDRSSGIRLERE